jgi:hypothetical protein
MPPVIKNSSVEESSSITRHNLTLGANNISYGPTSTTGFYNGIDAPMGGYVIYKATGAGKLNIFVANNNSELLSIVTRLRGTAVFGEVADAFNWLYTQNDYYIINTVLPDIVTDNLVFYVDAGQLNSYPQSDSSWRTLTGSSDENGVLLNAPTFSTDFGGILQFSDTAAQYAKFADLGNLGTFTVEAWVKITKPLTDKVSSVVTNQFDGEVLNFSIGTNGAPSSYKLCVGFFDANGWHNTVGIEPTLNEWYHIVATYDGATLNQYVNGSLDSTLSYGDMSPESGGEVRLMRRWDDDTSAGNLIDGHLGVVRIYSSALSAQEVLSNYNAESNRFPVTGATNTAEFYYDPGDPASYAGSGTALTNIGTLGNISGTAGTLNGVSYDSNTNNGVFDFDGGSDRIQFSQYNFGNTITVNAWVYPRNEYSINCLMSNAGANTATNGFKISWNNWNTTNLTMNFEAGNGTAGGTQSTAINTIVENQWQMITYVFDKTNQTIKFYKNGVEIATASGGSPVANISTNNANWWIGAIGGSSYFMNALMGEFKIWKSLRSGSEVLSEFNSSKSRYNL